MSNLNSFGVQTVDRNGKEIIQNESVVNNLIMLYRGSRSERSEKTIVSEAIRHINELNVRISELEEQLEELENK